MKGRVHMQWPAFVGLCAAVLAPATFPTWYLCHQCVALMLVVGVCGIALVLAACSRWQPSDPAARVALALLVLAAAAVAIFAYPKFGSGNDRDAALEQATAAVLRGAYPYYEVTFMGNPITPMPGALLLSLPFKALLGCASYANAAWVVVSTIVVVRLVRAMWTAFTLMAIAFCTPAGLHALLTGSDLFANAAAVVAGVVLTLTARDGWRVLAAMFLGVALSWRPTFALVIPVVAGVLVRRDGMRTAASLVGSGVASFAAVTLPFALYDFAHFSPLHVVSIGGPWPVRAAASLLGIGSSALGMLLARDVAGTLRWCYCVIALPVAFVTVASLLTGGTGDAIEYSHLAMMFGVAAFGPELVTQREAAHLPLRLAP